MSESPYQKAVLKYLREHNQITLEQAVILIGGRIYANANKHVGDVMSRMVKRGMIVRIKPGLFGPATVGNVLLKGLKL